jgi:hypothetical protein
MGDSILTNLCSVCHVSAPKYRCPRCQMRTCSVPCIKRHKARSDCSGTRDATAYVPRKKLATPAGVDHDYNFISSIERARQMSEKELMEERGIIGEGDLRPVMVERVQTRVRDGKMRKVVVTRPMNNQGRLEWEGMRSRLDKFDVVLVRAPEGMSRRKENQTKFLKRSRRIEWFVEWFLVSGSEGGHGTHRVTTKFADDVPIYEAFLRNRTTKEFAVKEGETGRVPVQITKRPSAADTIQDHGTSTWIPGSTTLAQNARNGQWTKRHEEHRQPGIGESDIQALRERVDFYVGRPKTTSGAPTSLKPVDPTMKLHDALSGTAVLEYPSIYVVERSAGVPPGFVVARSRGTKRRAEEEGREVKRRAVKELEDGEVRGGGEGDGAGGEDEDEDETGTESETETEDGDESEDGGEVKKEDVGGEGSVS